MNIDDLRSLCSALGDRSIPCCHRSPARRFHSNFCNGAVMAEQRDLPGWPKKRLVRDVRRHLWHYGIRPKGEAWRAAWSWASAIANSYYHTHWPMPSEIASQ